MTACALIIGTGAAGTQAALDLADAGVGVQLVTSEPFLANPPPSAGPLPAQSSRLLEIAKHPRITVWTHSRITQLVDDANTFRFAIRQQPRYVDLNTCTACGDCIDACPVTVPASNRKAVWMTTGAQPQCALIDKQGTAPCTAACPGGIPVQGYVALVAQGRFREALELVEEAIPFPGICGRVCTHPCEINCRRADVDETVSIRALKRFLADWALQHPCEQQAEPLPPAPDARQVAVVGSGPAGMTVADRLARWGYRVTVFEKLPVMGGMMSVGIPAYRLPREVIEREYRRILGLGIDLRLSTSVGPAGNYSIDELFDMGHSAVCLAVGAHKSLRLHIPGEALRGVVHGIDLLKALSISQQINDRAAQDAVDRMLPRGSATRAIVLGGGNTAMDAARCLRRLGLRSIRILYRRSRSEMPALPEEIADTELEGISIEYLTAPVRILGDAQTAVTGLECIRMQLTEPDGSGRPRPIPVDGTQYRLEADLVVLAIGQVPDIGAQEGIELTANGRIQLRNSGTMTTRRGVFAAGDAVTQDRMAVIEAIGMGRQAAAEIDAFLRGLSIAAPARPARLPTVHRELSEVEKMPRPRIPIPLRPVADRLGSFLEVETAYTPQQAMAEAARCLACGPCSECQACVKVCKPGAIRHEQLGRQTEISAGAVVLATGREQLNGLSLPSGARVYACEPQDPVAGSAAAAQALVDLSEERLIQPVRQGTIRIEETPRLGVFVCRCGGEISQYLDSAALCQRAANWPHVIHSGQIDFACTPDAARTIRETMRAEGLNRVVLAACSCCSMDQVCDSCSYQRVRCKRHLGVFQHDGETRLPLGAVEFVNIREHCAWPHGADLQTATAKATALVAAAVARARLTALCREPVSCREPRVLILGNGDSARHCIKALTRQGMAAVRAPVVPSVLRRRDGEFVAQSNGTSWQGTAVVLMPRDADELRCLWASWDGHPVHEAPAARGTMPKPGIFVCDCRADPVTAGWAVAARVVAWFGRILQRTDDLTASVDADRCRACATCVRTCENGAPSLTADAGQQHAWIDPAACTGCGSCVGSCPPGAISLGSSTDEQLGAAIEAILGW